jgi:hypothetical protein
METAAFGMSTVPPGASGGSYYPVMRAAEGGLFAVHYNVDYLYSFVERFSFPAAATPGPSPGGGGGGGGCAPSCAPANPRAVVNIDSPANGATVGNPFELSGWVIDTHAGGDSGIDRLDIWAVNQSTGEATYVGLPYNLYERGDVAAVHGERYRYSGFAASFSHLTPGRYTFVFYPHSKATGSFDFDNAKTWELVIQGGVVTQIDSPAWGVSYHGNGYGMQVTGWALDSNNPNGAGVDFIDIWAVNAFTGEATYLGRPTLGQPSLGPYVAYNSDPRYLYAGYTFTNTTALPTGTYYIQVFSHSVGVSTMNIARVIGVNIVP